MWIIKSSNATHDMPPRDWTKLIDLLVSIVWLTLPLAVGPISSLLFASEAAPKPSPLKVEAPPPEMKLDAFYKKYVSANGYPIVSSEKVDDHALLEAAYLVDLLLHKRPDVREAMVKNGSRMTVIAHNEFTTDIPEHRNLMPKDYWDRRARGTGGSLDDPICTCGEENLLAYPGDPYVAESILIHEFAHNIHLRGMVNVDPSFDARVKKTFESAIAQGLWKGAYAATNHHEYFAEGVQSWFDNNRPPDHDHNHVDTRRELKEYDPGLAKLCEEVFGETELTYTKPTTRLTGHLADYDPSKAPAFRWPERLARGSPALPRPVLGGLALMAFSGWTATVAGWYVTEVGRQPWIVQGLLRVDEVASTVPGSHIAFTLALYLTVYLALLVAYVSVVKHMAEKPVPMPCAPFTKAWAPQGRSSLVPRSGPPLSCTRVPVRLPPGREPPRWGPAW